MRQYSPPTSGRRDKLRLDFNENTIGPPRSALDALARLTLEDLASYPEYDGMEALLAEHLGVKPDQIVATNATDEAIRLFLDTFVEPGSGLVLPVPTFAMFRFYAEIGGIPLREIPYEPDLSFPIEAVLSAMDQGVGGVILCHPNNPTGTLVPNDAIERILQRALDLGDLAVLVDEAYHEFSRRTFVDLIDRYPGLVVSRTFSKAYGLAGLRLGCLVSNRQAAAALRKAASPYSVNVAAMAAARAVLESRAEVEAYVAEVDKTRPTLVEGLRKHSQRVHAGSANFVLAWFGARSGLIRRALAKSDVLVRDRSSDHGLFGVLRFTIGTSDQVVRALAALDEIMEPRALLFDMDGVLVDVSQSYREAIRQTAEHFLGRPVAGSEIQSAKEAGGAANDWELTHRIVARGGEEVPFARVREFFQSLYLGSGSRPGLREREGWMAKRDLIEGLKRRFRLGIVTARPRAEAQYTLERFGISGLFDALVCAEDCRPKPDPDGLLQALEKLGCCAGAYLGDGVDDVSAASACGITPIGVMPAGVEAPSLAGALRLAGASRVLDSVNELEGEWIE